MEGNTVYRCRKDGASVRGKKLVERMRGFLSYRGSGGIRSFLLPDFFIGAHPLVDGMELLTRAGGTVSGALSAVEAHCSVRA